jgi:hypothetical protein
MSIYPSTKASNVSGGGAGVSSPGSRAGPYGGQRSGKKRGSAFAPFGSSLGFGVMFGGEGQHYGGGDAAGAGAHGFGEVDKQWGPQNTSWERMPPMRIFEAKDSKNACITDCHVSLDGRYLVFTQVRRVTRRRSPACRTPRPVCPVGDAPRVHTLDRR